MACIHNNFNFKVSLKQISVFSRTPTQPVEGIKNFSTDHIQRTA